MESVLDYLEMLEEIIDNARAVPFSTRVSVDRDKVMEVLTEMRMNIPVEIRQAQRIIEDRERIIDEAKNKADVIVREANGRAQDMVDEHEVYKRAVEQATEMMEENKKNVRDLRVNSLDYADGILSGAESALREALDGLNKQYQQIEDSFIDTINEIYDNRQELRGGKG